MNRKGTTLYFSSPTNWDKRREVSRHRISQFRLLVDIYSTLCILWVEGEGWKLWQKLNKFIQTADCAIIVILCFHSRGQHLFKFIATKESVYIRKKSSTLTGLVWDTNMTAVSLFWDTNTAAMTASENTELVQSTKFPLRCGMQKKASYMTTYRITKQHICYMLILWNNTIFKLFHQNEGLNKLGWVPA